MEITVNTTHDTADIVADIFFNMGCQGVSIADKKDILDIMNRADGAVFWDYIDEEILKKATDIVKVTSFFLQEEYESRRKELSDALDDLKANSGAEFCGSLEITAREIDDADWENNWKKYYKPITAGGIQIIPEWLKGKKQEGKTVIYLDPGMAFGTGEHETTKMCLMLMQDIPLAGKTVYDIGTGSGILGIAAAKLGAYVIMSDIDPTSVLTAKQNAEKNGVKDKVNILRADLTKDGAFKDGGADVAFANITADILIRLSGGIKNSLKKNGVLILSGIINEKKQAVIDKYLEAGFKVLEEKTEGGWIALRLLYQNQDTQSHS